jgi:hypothetical protein
MTANLTSTNINFSDGTTMSSIYNIVPLNSVAVFYQSVQPLGWTKSTSHNQKALRVVSSGGGSSGGSSSFPSIFKSYSVNSSSTVTGSANDTLITAPMIGPHLHGVAGGGAAITIGGGGGDVGTGGGWQRPDTVTGSSSSSNSPHTHPFSGTAPYSYSFSLNVQYIDVIICSFTKTT